ncbi:hypothetical protein [Novipirellula caenicola]|uniref:DUF1963 domain-containing protein n=1 Tax=Novipirellula caenicola TaxID=1536901 RepID=A0ABP9W153_9BACT
MKDTLESIERLYRNEIPRALGKLPDSPVLYGAFIPYSAWENDPESAAENGLAIFLLEQPRLQRLRESSSDPNEVSRQAYGWGEFMGGPETSIESTDLHSALLHWYQYQGEQDESVDLLDDIGGAIARACLDLNSKGWNGNRFTDDFVVFTDCWGDEEHNVDLRACVTDQWIAAKRGDGMLAWLAK